MAWWCEDLPLPYPSTSYAWAREAALQVIWKLEFFSFFSSARSSGSGSIHTSLCQWYFWILHSFLIQSLSSHLAVSDSLVILWAYFIKLAEHKILSGKSKFPWGDSAKLVCCGGLCERLHERCKYFNSYPIFKLLFLGLVNPLYWLLSIGEWEDRSMGENIWVLWNFFWLWPNLKYFYQVWWIF